MEEIELINQAIEKQNCTGCKMCQDICPTLAINFSVDQEGFWYPKIDEKKCIQCNKCIKSCPVLHKPEINKEKPAVFAVWSKDKKIRRRSTSGGAYYELAKAAIDMGWFISGVIYTEDYKAVKHVLVNDMDGLLKVMGSKYFQSDTKEIYYKIKTLLDKNEKVLFCGTPCQNAALKSYLNKEYSNLVQCDFICRGINSPKAYRYFIETYEKKYHSKIVNVQFKNKKYGWTRYGTLLEFQNGKKYFRENYRDYWTLGYNKANLYMRSSCHDCNFKGILRYSDFTLADFWNIRGFPKKEYKLGISMLLIHSPKGKKFFEKAKNGLIYYKRKEKDIGEVNLCLNYSVKPGKNREYFFNNIEKKAFDELIRECIEPSYSQYMLWAVKHHLRRRLKGFRTL